MFLDRLPAVLVAGALVTLSVSPAAANVAPHPAATPLKTISNIRSSPLCTGLRRAIAPAVGKVLQSDRFIASSRPLFKSFVRASTDRQSKPAEDMAVMRLEQLVGPLVANTERVDELLRDPYAFPRVARSDGDRQLLKMRAQLQTVNEQQKHALDVISGFVATQQMGELQGEGHEMDRVLASEDTRQSTATPAPAAPTSETPSILNAGVGNNDNDPTRKLDPRYHPSGNTLAASPLDVFGNAIASYQHDIQSTEQAAAKSLIAAVPLCGGHVPGQPEPSPSPSP